MKKDKWSTVLLIVILVIGVSLLLYPSFSDYWNSLHQSYAVASYVEKTASIQGEDYHRILEEAQAYNRSILEREHKYALTDPEKEIYLSTLNISDNGIMGYIQIPSIDVVLPMYHGTEDAILQVAIGHLEWTSLPVGGESTHCVVSGHRGLPSARLFTDLDQLVVGDYFMMHILDETLTYEVDQIRIVEPDETEDLLIQEGKDLCTLVTCTPYGINSHRLLVRGHRVENAAQTSQVRVSADAVRVQPLVVAAVLFLPILLLILGVLSLFERRTKKKT